MRSRGMRVLFGAVAWVAIGAAAMFLFDSEKQLAAARATMRAFDLRARETADALGDLRASQQAYVAAGQGVGFWMPRVTAAIDSVSNNLMTLRQSAVSEGARAALDEAAAAVAEFGHVDTRVRDYLESGAQLMAADVVFTEGGEAAASAGRQAERARLEEQQAMDLSEAARRWQEALALAGASGLLALIVLLLVPAPRTASDNASTTLSIGRVATGDAESTPTPAGDDLILRRETPPTPAPQERRPRAANVAEAVALPALRAAAQLCTDLGRVNDPEELTKLLARAADVLGASGLMVWLGNKSGADLRPALAHGYSADVVARLPAVPRSANNAAAAAYRTGTLQIVRSRPGSSDGAVVAPLLSAEGCIGALSAEIRDGGEVSDAVQALASIFAAQLSGLLASAPDDGSQAAAQG